MLEIKYGKFMLHGNGRNKITKIDGVGACPTPSYQTTEYASADGVTELSKKDMARTVTISGVFIDNDNRDMCKKLNRCVYFKNYLYIISDVVRVKLYCKLTNLSINHKGANIFTYTLQLSADYPFFKSYADKLINIWGDVDNVISVRGQANGILIDNLTVKPLLEVGTTMPTSFEPYITPVTTNIFLDEPLRKVGDYADYVDFERQKVVRNVNMCGIEQAGGLITSYTNLNALQIAKKEDDVGYMNQSTSLSMLSNLVEYIIKPSGFDDSRLINKIYVAGAGVYFIGLPKSITTKEDAVEYLTHLKLYYRRSTPIEEDITLPALPQFKGTTIYEVQTNTVPSGMEAKYI